MLKGGRKKSNNPSKLRYNCLSKRKLKLLLKLQRTLRNNPSKLRYNSSKRGRPEIGAQETVTIPLS